MHRILLHIIILSAAVSFGQEIQSADYSSKLVVNKKSAILSYCGQDHHFKVNFSGKNIQEVELANGVIADKNKHFIGVDKTVIQTVLIPIKSPLLGSGPISQQATLDTYLQYELDHMVLDLNVIIADPLKMSGNIDSREYLLWKYKLADNLDSTDEETVKGYINISTICFDQILTLSIPMTDLSTENKNKRRLRKLVRQISIYDTPCSE